MARSAKEVTVVVLDVGSSMAAHLPHARRTLQTFLHNKMVYKPSHEVAVVLFGTSETDNALNQQAAATGDLDNYLNIVEASPMQPPTLHTLRRVHDLSSDPQGVSTFPLALAVAVKVMQNAIVDDATRGGDKVRRRIVLISDFASLGEEDQEFLKQLMTAFVSKTMTGLNISLEVAYINPHTSNRNSSLEGTRGRDENMNNKTIDATPLAATARSLNDSLLQFLCDSIPHATIRRYTHSVDLEGFFPFKDPVKTTTQFSGHLEIGSTTKIAVKMTGKVHQEKFPTIGKQSPLGHGGILASREYYRTDQPEETREPVADDDRLEGVRYGKQYIPFGGAIKENAQYKPQRCMQVVGFTDVDSVPRHQHMGAPYVLVGNKDNEASCVALAALVRAMHRSNQVAIVRGVIRDRAAVKMYAAHPIVATNGNDDDAPDHLLLSVLPYQEDARYNFEFPTFDKEGRVPTDEMLQAAFDMIDKMSLLVRNDDKGCGGENDTQEMEVDRNAHIETVEEEILVPEATPNPSLCRFANFFAERALDNTSPVVPAEEDALLQRIAQMRLDVMPHAVEIAAAAAVAIPTGGDAKVLKKANRAARNLRAGHEAEDFVEIMKTAAEENDDQKRSNAISAMRKHIEALVNSSSGDYQFGIAVQRLDVLRRECIAQHLAAQFNQHLDLLRDNYAKDVIKGKFWRDVYDGGIRPVTSDEVPNSAVTVEEARRYMEDSVKGSGGGTQTQTQMQTQRFGSGTGSGGGFTQYTGSL